ncbi:hypothetical protein KIPB_006493 [Kipferlia bialata]|uniref:2Fe-2S ferredoxin-type domain-containing protein n=1 Tax=Kipferlia bialata TaxID=797122 RepID=A0A9K3CX49_9EUKA|nr:hypothetical protein KIPB_006493 [Kipferlia bialata]|eukprot:g6493.t1
MDNTLVFYLNGRRVATRDVHPSVTLSTYLHSINLRGTKVACGEGGCGACTVMVSYYEEDTQSCFAPTPQFNVCSPLCLDDSALRGQVKLNGYTCYVGWVGDERVGFVQFESAGSLGSTPDSVIDSEIDSAVCLKFKLEFGVAEACRGRGLGREMLSLALSTFCREVFSLTTPLPSALPQSDSSSTSSSTCVSRICIQGDIVSSNTASAHVVQSLGYEMGDSFEYNLNGKARAINVYRKTYVRPGDGAT